MVLSPDGSSGGGGGGGGKPDKVRRHLARKPSGGGGGGSYSWNTIDMSGVNEVNFIQAMLDAEYLEGGPKLAMGFSGGAAMSSLMCCKNTTDVIVAHVACYVDDGASFHPSCSDVIQGKDRRLNEQQRNLANVDKTYSAIGLSDYFLDGTTNDQLFASFAARKESVCPELTTVTCTTEQCNDIATCPDGSCIGIDALDNNTNPGFQCYTYPGCDKAGRLCTYVDLFGHEIDTTMLPEAYSYLTDNTETYDSSDAGGSVPGLSPSPPSCFYVWQSGLLQKL